MLITTIKFTQQGLQGIRESPKRATAFKSVAKRIGIRVKDIYWTLGEFDGVIIFDAPDDATATASMMQLSSCGNVLTKTVRAFGPAEMEKVVDLMANM